MVKLAGLSRVSVLLWSVSESLPGANGRVVLCTVKEMRVLVSSSSCCYHDSPYYSSYQS